MKIKLINGDLANIYNMLMKIEAKKKQARAVNKFSDRIMDKVNENKKDELELLKEYCELDEDGKVKVDNDGNSHLLKDKQAEGLLAINEMRNEECVIDLTEFEPFFDSLMSALNNSDALLSGLELKAYDILLDKLEEIKAKEGKAKKNAKGK